jgi:hypothetical protein
MPENNYAFVRKTDGNPAAKEFYLGLIMWTLFTLIGPLFIVLIWILFSKIAAYIG